MSALIRAVILIGVSAQHLSSEPSVTWELSVEQRRAELGARSLALLERALASNDPGMRQMGLFGLTVKGQHAGIRLLRLALYDVHPLVRFVAIDGLCRVQDGAAAREILNTLPEWSESSRLVGESREVTRTLLKVYAACFAFKVTQDQNVAGLLRSYLRDEEVTKAVREVLIKAVGNWEIHDLAKEVARWQNDEWLRCSAARSLAILGDEQARLRFRACISELKFSAVFLSVPSEHVQSLFEKEDQSLLFDYLMKSEDPTVQTGSARTLSLLGDKRGYEYLIQNCRALIKLGPVMPRGADYQTSIGSVSSLGEVGRTESLELLGRVMELHERDVLGLAAAASIQQILSPTE